MDGVIMHGKLVKVKQYNLEFGTRDRYVNILGCFKYIPNGNIYIIYTDVDTKYNLIYYGSGHIRENIALCMKCREKQEEEIIKEYIFKLLQKDNLNNFQIISLETVENIEIITSDKFEVKPEILTSLIDIVIPKPEIKEEVKETPVTVSTTKKKKNTKLLLVLLLIIITIGIGGYLFLTLAPKETTRKYITCSKTYSHKELTATVEETNTYNFANNDELQTIDTTTLYQFNEKNYQDFILKGTYYKYMPSSNSNGGWDKNDTEYTFKVITKTKIDTSYNKPTNYEEVLSYYKHDGYTCTESIAND